MARGDEGSRAQTPLGEGVAFEPVDYPAETGYHANASTCSDAAVSGPESVPSSETRVKNCSKCKAHGQKAEVKLHKNVCPFKDCLCKDCLPVILRRHSTARAQSDRRRKNPGASSLPKRSAGTLPKPRKREKPPQCTKCRNHGTFINFKGHKEHCEQKTCTCTLCMVSDEKRFNTRTAQFRRRTQYTPNSKTETAATDKVERNSTVNLSDVSSTTKSGPAIQTTTVTVTTPPPPSIPVPSVPKVAITDDLQDPSSSGTNRNESVAVSRIVGNLFYSSTENKSAPWKNNLASTVEPDTSNGSTPATDKKSRQRSCVKRRHQTDVFPTTSMNHTCESRNCKYVFCDNYDERKTRRARRRAARAASIIGTRAADSTGLNQQFNEGNSARTSSSSTVSAASPPTNPLGFPLTSPRPVKKIQFPSSTNCPSAQREDSMTSPTDMDASIGDFQLPSPSEPDTSTNGDDKSKIPWDSLHALSCELNYGLDCYPLLHVILKFSNYNVVTAYRMITKGEDSKEVLWNSVIALCARCRVKTDYYALLDTIVKTSNLNVVTAYERIMQAEKEVRAAWVRAGFPPVPWPPISPGKEPTAFPTGPWSPGLVVPSARSSDCDTSSQNQEAGALDTVLPCNEHSLDKSSLGSSTHCDELIKTNPDCSSDAKSDPMENQSISTTVPEPTQTHRDEQPKMNPGLGEMKLPLSKSSLTSSESSNSISLTTEESGRSVKPTVNPLNWRPGECQQNPLLFRRYLEANLDIRNTRNRRAPPLASPTTAVGYPDMPWVCKQSPSFVAGAAVNSELMRRRGGGGVLSHSSNRSPDCDTSSHEEASSVESVITTTKDKSPEPVQCDDITKTNSDYSSEIKAEIVDENIAEPISLSSSAPENSPHDVPEIVNNAKVTPADVTHKISVPPEDSPRSIPLTWRAAEYHQNPMFFKRYFEDRDARKWIDREAPFVPVVNIPLPTTPYGQPFLASSIPLYFDVQNTILRTAHTIPFWNGTSPEGDATYPTLTPPDTVSPSEASSTQSKGDYRGNHYPCYYPNVFFKDYSNPTLSM